MINATELMTSSKGSAVILMYHRVVDLDVDPWRLAVSPTHFSEQLHELKKNFQPISLSQLIEGIRQNNIPERACVLTFDDGYLDNYLNALPILTKFEIPATIFIPTGCLDNPNEFWWDALEQVFLHTDPLPQHLELKLNGSTLNFVVNHQEEYTSNKLLMECRTHPWQAKDGTRLKLYFDVWKTLNAMNDLHRFGTIQMLMNWSRRSVVSRPMNRCVTTEELVNLDQSELITIGGHSESHTPMPKLTPAQIDAELARNREALETRLDHPVFHFAYPHGAFDEICKKSVLAAGFASACAVNTDAGKLITNLNGLYDLPRVAIMNCSGAEFRTRISSFFHG
jgi:peptidoglycan/xylan/chitin deacetylase (PgdA/CDA1 family)